VSAIRPALLALGLLVCPVAIVQGMLVWRLHATIADCDAVVMDDECHYWNEIATFQTVGFRGGCFVNSERTASANWTHFGPHGPAYPVLVGTLARLSGWSTASGALFNVLALTLSIVTWLALVRPDGRQLAATLFMVATFWPCLLYLPATLQESLHCAVAFVLAGLAHRTVNGNAASSRDFWPFLAAVALASLFRITWVVVLIPWLVISARGRGTANKFLMASATMVVGGMVYLVWHAICAPYPNFLAAVFETAGDSMAGQLRLLLDHADFSAQELVSFRDCTLLEILQRYQAIALVGLSILVALCPGKEGSTIRMAASVALACFGIMLIQKEVIVGVFLTMVAVWKSWRYGRSAWPVLASAVLTGALYVLQTDKLALMLLGPVLLDVTRFALTATLVWLQRDLVNLFLLLLARLLRLDDEDARPYVFAGLNLGLVLFVVVTLYDVQDWRDYRVVAPHMLLSLLILASGPARRWAIRIALVNLLFLPAFVNQFEQHHRIRVDHERTKRVVIDLRHDLKYNPAAKSPWENTLLVPEVDPSNRVRVPAGIGVCWSVPFSGGGRLCLRPTSPYFVAIQRVGDAWLELPPKSKYIFATPNKLRSWRGCRLELMREMPQGNLYRNLDVAADDN
jgi:hypothetical protein